MPRSRIIIRRPEDTAKELQDHAAFIEINDVDATAFVQSGGIQLPLFFVLAIWFKSAQCQDGMQKEQACEYQDIAIGLFLHNKLADVCVDMCKELGDYPEKCACPGYTDTTDKTPGVMTWDELLTYMDDLDRHSSRIRCSSCCEKFVSRRNR